MRTTRPDAAPPTTSSPTATAPGAAPGAAASSGGGARERLRGLSFEQQEAALRPPGPPGRPAPPSIAPIAAPMLIATRTMSNVGRGPDMGVNDHAALPGLGGAANTLLATSPMAQAAVGAHWEGLARGGAAYREHQDVGHVVGSAMSGFVHGAAMAHEVTLASPNASLIDALRTETSGVAGAEGAAVTDRFAANSAAERVLNDGNSTVPGLAARHASLLASQRAVEAELQNRLVASHAAHPDRPASFHTIGEPPYIDFEQGSGVLQTVLGGTRGYEVWAERVSQEGGPDGTRYSIAARYKVFDNFAFDPSDMYSPGLLAGGILQHYRGYHPFVHCVEVPVTLHGDLAAAPGEVHADPTTGAAAAAPEAVESDANASR